MTLLSDILAEEFRKYLRNPFEPTPIDDLPLHLVDAIRDSTYGEHVKRVYGYDSEKDGKLQRVIMISRSYPSECGIYYGKPSAESLGRLTKSGLIRKLVTEQDLIEIHTV